MSDKPEENPAQIPPPISVDAAIADVIAPPEETKLLEAQYDERFTVQAVDVERAYENLIGLRDHFRHKKYWSWFLMALMGFLVLFQSWLLWMIGGGWWDFHDYQWLLPTLMIQYLVQIAGLALFVVRSLFKELN